MILLFINTLNKQLTILFSARFEGSYPDFDTYQATKAIVSLQAILWLLILVQVDGFSDRIAGSDTIAPGLDTFQATKAIVSLQAMLWL